MVCINSNRAVAYGLFNSAAGAGYLDSILLSIRELLKTPSDLEVELNEGLGGLDSEEDSHFRKFALAIERSSDYKYAIKVAVPESTSNRASSLLLNMFSWLQDAYPDKDFSALIYARSGD